MSFTLAINSSVIVASFLFLKDNESQNLSEKYTKWQDLISFAKPNIKLRWSFVFCNWCAISSHNCITISSSRRSCTDSSHKSITYRIPKEKVSWKNSFNSFITHRKVHPLIFFVNGNLKISNFQALWTNAE